MKKFFLVLLMALVFAFPVFSQTETETLNKNARKLTFDGKFSEAVAEISKAIDIEPNNPDFYLTRGAANLQLQKKEAVLEDAQNAAALAPTDHKILYSAASLLNLAGYNREALRVADAQLALGGADHSAWFQRMLIKKDLKDFAGAFEDASRGAELFPEETSFKQFQAEIVRSMGDSKKALEMYNVLVTTLEIKLTRTKNADDKFILQFDLSKFLFKRAELNFAQSYTEQAKIDLLRAVELLPDRVTYSRRAKIYRQQKMYAEAAADLTKAMEITPHPHQIQYLIERGDVFFSMGKFAEAIADFELVIKLDETKLQAQMVKHRIKFARSKMREYAAQPK